MSVNIQRVLLSQLLLLPTLTVAASPEGSWLDNLHLNVTESVQHTAEWFDSFFATEAYETSESARSRARIMLAWEPRSRDLLEFESRVRINWKLPKLKNQVDVVFSDYDEELEKAPVKAAQNDQLADQNRFNLALRWNRGGKNQNVWSHRVGVGRKLQPFARSQYVHSFDVADKHTLRLELSGYYYTKDGLGAHIGSQYEYVVDNRSVLRFDSNFYYRDNSEDWVWQHSAYRMQQASSNSARISGIYIEGVSRPNYQVSEYLVSSRWRKNAWRSWLYFELEPFILWKRNHEFRASYGIALRVEGFFGP